MAVFTKRQAELVEYLRGGGKCLFFQGKFYDFAIKFPSKDGVDPRTVRSLLSKKTVKLVKVTKEEEPLAIREITSRVELDYIEGAPA